MKTNVCVFVCVYVMDVANNFSKGQRQTRNTPKGKKYIQNICDIEIK